MKARHPKSSGDHGPEFKGIVKKIAGRLTGDSALEEEGREEMSGPQDPAREPRRADEKDPDPHRRG